MALRPPKSGAAVPAIRECTAMTVIVINTAHQPTTYGNFTKNSAINPAKMKLAALHNAAGGPRRDWKNLSETQPPAKPPTIPKTQTRKPQFCVKNQFAGRPVSFAKMEYQFMIPLRTMPTVTPISATVSIILLANTFLSRCGVLKVRAYGRTRHPPRQTLETRPPPACP